MGSMHTYLAVVVHHPVLHILVALVIVDLVQVQSTDADAGCG